MSDSKEMKLPEENPSSSSSSSSSSLSQVNRFLGLPPPMSSSSLSDQSLAQIERIGDRLGGRMDRLEYQTATVSSIMATLRASNTSNKRKLATPGAVQMMAILEVVKMAQTTQIADFVEFTNAVEEYIGGVDDDTDIEDALKDLERRLRRVTVLNTAEEMVSILKRAHKKAKAASQPTQSPHRYQYCAFCGKTNHTIDNCFLKARQATASSLATTSPTPPPSTNTNLTLTTDVLSQLLGGRGRSAKKCDYCHKTGHVETECWTKFPEKKPKGIANNQAPAPKQ
eukprot:TRINITY_DN3186_c0_g1_i1.p1 TRINITY_DN3186_c0_g1~~TRINITY_DN3186_c0_g1_i1.p1  ORF type:complete len:283 (+),score=44.37 TRINITY_DN3186_c0_g1_i1:29-877(+)